MKKTLSREVREKWIRFFESKGHYYIPRSNLIPIEDQSLLFINSGVSTLKKYFEGKETPPNQRLVNIQPVVRTNDINAVGQTTRHHTFFEMLGNFSIGDYFKKDAIKFGWEFLTSKSYLNINKNLLYITVYQDDQEAIEIWEKMGVSSGHIFKMGKDTNFWDMGVGPCGPSTEIFYDKGKKYSKKSAKELIQKDIENDRYIEIWNIVFSEFNNDGKGNYTELPQKNIDTGAGLERIISCLEDAPTNFETELFLPIISEIEKYTTFNYLKYYNPQELKAKFVNKFNINADFKVIADFMRTLVFTLNDGVIPGATGRGYVIRKLIRRGLLSARKLHIKGSVLHKLVDVTISTLSDSYPEILKNRDKIVELLRAEEEQFFKTVDYAINHFHKEDLSKFNEELAFKYYETYGLPLDFIEQLVQENNLTIDKQKLDLLYRNFQLKSKNAYKKVAPLEQQKNLFFNVSPTNFVGYSILEIKANVIAKEDDFIAFDRTPFYAESGGQVSDIGTANEFIVADVKKNAKGVYIHDIPKNDFKIGQSVELIINIPRREQITIHHSSTHIMFSALEQVLGVSLHQAGSKVDDQELRFDFSYQGKISEKNLNDAQKIANKWIKDRKPTLIKEMALDEALKMGATFLEDIKYGDRVRVVKLNDHTIDLCGGTHVKSLRSIEQIQITNFEKKGSGVYRINAISTKKLVKQYRIKTNTEYLENHITLIKKDLDKLNKRKNYVPEFDYKFLENKCKRLEKLDRSDRLWRDKFDAGCRRINQHIKKFYRIANNNLLEKIENFVDQNNDNKIKFLLINDFNANEILKDALNLMETKDDKILLLTLKNQEKLTIMIVLPKNFSDQNIFNEITDNLTKIGFRGNGKQRLYMYGGKKELLDNLKKVYKLENN